MDGVVFLNDGRVFNFIFEDDMAGRLEKRGQECPPYLLQILQKMHYLACRDDFEKDNLNKKKVEITISEVKETLVTL